MSRLQFGLRSLFAILIVFAFLMRISFFGPVFSVKNSAARERIYSRLSADTTKPPTKFREMFYLKGTYEEFEFHPVEICIRFHCETLYIPFLAGKELPVSKRTDIDFFRKQVISSSLPSLPRVTASGMVDFVLVQDVLETLEHANSVNFIVDE
ncbi:hypothetical protein SH501x_000242 [Pirellulaceae bacterium SH501]